MVSITSDYISVGGNRHPGAADWDVQTGVVAFGADNNVALWDPRVCIIIAMRWTGGLYAELIVGKFSTRGVCSPREPYR